MGEKEEVNKKEGGEKKKKEEEAAVGPTAVVLKVDIHCEGCARKFKKLLKNFPGVDAVSADMANNKLTVVGSVDPLKIREHVGSKTGKKVDLISPQPNKKDEGSAGPKKAQPDSKDQKKADDKKPKPPVSTTVGLKIRLHCDGCIQRIRKNILRFKGVESVTVDSQKDLVTVKGTMDMKELVPYLKEKLKRDVDLVAGEKKDGGGSEKKDKGNANTNAGGEKKEKGGGDGDKEEKGKGGEGGDKKKEAATEANKMEYYGPYGGGGGGYYGVGVGYRVETVHAPQMFSDENPNACTVM
ncbi:heavy metal-associated isoprenylated plant protein 3-like [Iris pallida]|uniref:Heavy metal-associated isoprenylated plant protein 3-like n=1 Tax=Iris pallida TaxID=29817 RepID=A0AAX6HPU8_IRIPA|nr:heavy metal-associated isoprenylated plant protein 3-like [Iris pallida]